MTTFFFTLVLLDATYGSMESRISGLGRREPRDRVLKHSIVPRAGFHGNKKKHSPIANLESRILAPGLAQ